MFKVQIKDEILIKLFMKKLILYFKNNWLFAHRFRLKVDFFVGSKYSSWNIRVLLRALLFQNLASM